MFNHYVTRNKITSFTFIKERTYYDENQAISIENNLNILKNTKFDFVCIPYFEHKRSGNDLKIECEFIKGWYSYEMTRIYDDLVSKEWTFSDVSPWNFIQCSQTQKTYMVDIDSFCHCPYFSIRNLFWAKKQNDWQRSLQGNIKNLKLIEKSC